MMARRSMALRREIPYLHEKRIEREADVLLAEYAEIIEPIMTPPVPIEELVGTVLELRHQFFDMKSIFPFADVLGAIWFENATIGIDSHLNPDTFPRRRGRYHFTLAHEVGHWRLHRQHYIKNPAERMLFDDGSPKPDVICRSSERKKPVEWQADTFAASLLMPRKMVYSAWSEFRGGDAGPVEIRELHDAHAESSVLIRGQTAATAAELEFAVQNEFCRPLAEQFEVSREAMRIRLVELNLIVRERPQTLF
jgi:Zn-dependent peptidase ImmA (M78 family)